MRLLYSHLPPESTYVDAPGLPIGRVLNEQAGGWRNVERKQWSRCVIMHGMIAESSRMPPFVHADTEVGLAVSGDEHRREREGVGQRTTMIQVANRK